MATWNLDTLRPKQLGALLTGLLLGAGTGALAGWPVGVGVGGALTALMLMVPFVPQLATRRGINSTSVPISLDGVEIYHVSDALVLQHVSTFVETLRSMRQRPRVLILDLTGLIWIDATALRIIHQTLDRERESGMLVLVAGCDPSSTACFNSSRPLPETVVFDSLDDAVQRARIHLMRGRGR